MKKRAVSVYLPLDQLERVRIAAAIAGTSMTGVVEKAVVDWLEKNRRAIDEAVELLKQCQLR